MVPSSTSHFPCALLSPPLPYSHLEGHILPAGLDISSLHLLLDSNAQTSSQGLHQTCSANGHTSNTLCPGAPCPVSLDSLQTRPQLQHAPRPGAASHDAIPDLRQLSPEQLVRLCLPEELIHDLTGLTVIGRGSQSATCSGKWVLRGQGGGLVDGKFCAPVRTAGLGSFPPWPLAYLILSTCLILLLLEFLDFWGACH